MSTAAVVGVGRAGAGYDRTPGPVPRSHLGALLRCGFSVTALTDTSSQALRTAIETWPELAGARTTSSIDALPVGIADVIVLATPPDSRLEQIRALLDRRPRVLIVEKPLALSTEAAECIARVVAQSGAEVRVNFQRRFDAGHVAARSLIGERPSKVVMTYGKGLFNYASHLVDLAVDWFGEVEAVTAVGSVAAENPSFYCRMARGFDLFVIGIDELTYDQFDVDVLMPAGRLELRLGGCERTIQRPVEARFYPGYTHLGPPERIGAVGPIGGIVDGYENVRAYLQGIEPLRGCNVIDAAHGVAVLDAVCRSREWGRPVTLLPLVNRAPLGEEPHG